MSADARGASRSAALGLVLCGLLALNGCRSSAAPDSAQRGTGASPTVATEWRRVLWLEDYNTRVVVLSTGILGCAAGMVGSFALLRKRALLGDALSHATLPGIGLAFITASWLGFDGKSLPWLLSGATVTGLIGVLSILAIRRWTRLKDDAAMGIVLSVFFGAGMALLGVVQQMKGGNAAGLEGFIFGKTASMVARDAWLIGWAGAISVGVCALLFKEFKLLCFDDAFAGSQGLPVLALDLSLMALIVLVSIVGLQAVGLILMIALLVIPPAAARFWTETAWRLMLAAGVLGALGGVVGALISGLFAQLPSGAMIVLVCALFFLASLIFGTSRGVLARTLRRQRLKRSVARQHLLRALYESIERRPETQGAGPVSLESLSAAAVPWDQLLSKRSWSRRELKKAIQRAVAAGLVDDDGVAVRLTRRGCLEAARWTRQHRLWEIYLIQHADIAPSQVDRDADAIEHVLQPEVVAELEAILDQQPIAMPASPHRLPGGTEQVESVRSFAGGNDVPAG